MPIYTSPQDGASVVTTLMQNTAPTTTYAGQLWSGESNADGNGFRGIISISGLLSDIPSSATILSASLFIKTKTDYSNNTRTKRIFRSKRTVNMSQMTWNIYSTGNNWQTAGGFGANDCEQTDIGSISMTASESIGAWKEIELSPSAIQEIISGTWTTPYLLLKTDTESDDLYVFYGSNDGTPTNRPYMVIEYGSIKSVGGVGQASIKKIAGVAIADVKKVAGVE